MAENGYSYAIGDENYLESTKEIKNDKPNYLGEDGLDQEPCPNPECYWHDERGFCLFESCLLNEVPKIHARWFRKCDICRKTYIVAPPTIQPWTHVCEKCRRHWQDVILNDDWFTCGICGARQCGKRQAPDADICDTCIDKLRVIIFNCPLVN